MNTINKLHFPNDIVREILSHIDPNDNNTLYSCLLVNHVWCELTIPLLWSNPFNLIKKDPRRLVTTFFDFLDEKTKSITGSQNHKKFLIKYPTYLRKVSFMDIYDGVLDWVIFNDKTHGEPEEIPAKEDQVFSIMLSKEILKMILNNSPGLEYLKIDVSRELKRRTRCESIPFPFLSADHNAGLPKLNTLHCSNDNANNEILLSLAKSTTSIKNLIINENDWDYGDIGTVNSAITKLVNAQKGIEKVIIKRVSRGVTDILLSLYSQKKTLKGIQLDHVSFGNDEQDLKCISEFSENLEEIRFINCYNLTDNVVRPLLNMEFPRLTTLEINNRHFYLLPEKCPTKEILELIKNLGNHLTELIVNASYQLTLYDSIFHHIQKYCGNLTTLGLSIGYKQLPHLLELFKSLKNLQRFIVQSDGGLCYIDNWLKVIAEGIPLTITSLEVNGWIMSPDGLKGFLNFSKNKIKVLEWRLPFGNKFEDYSSIIEDYSSNIYFVQISQRKLKEQIWDEARVEFV